ncbi:MAG: 50S ribosome-binding GTPase [Candidatus Shikimatogenerans bostrichidophilus]|nr:MAG: 50S ribosome-binding GTPase [Candidatus Shikimatogenerans bostrichidophilus]
MLYKNFIDNTKIICKSGNGGHGCVNFLRTTKKIGKPNGGNGGNGGNIIFIGNKNIFNLYYLNKIKSFKAEDGYNGMKNCKTGKNGKDCIIYVPLYTEIYYSNKFNKNNNILIKYHKQKEYIIYGGKGGKGNNYYKNSYNQKTRKYSLGIKGTKLNIELKLNFKIDISILGLPNSGKTTLLSKITNNKKLIIDNYEYTTIIPNLGVYKNKYNNYLIIDIPAIKKKYSIGKRINKKYIKYIINNKIIIFVISIIKNIKEYNLQYNILINEIKYYNIKNNNIIIVITKYNNIRNKEILLLKNKFFKKKIKYFFFDYKKKINKLKKIIYNIIN